MHRAADAPRHDAPRRTRPGPSPGRRGDHRLDERLLEGPSRQNWTAHEPAGGRSNGPPRRPRTPRGATRGDRDGGLPAAAPPFRRPAAAEALASGARNRDLRPAPPTCDADPAGPAAPCAGGRRRPRRVLAPAVVPTGGRRRPELMHWTGMLPSQMARLQADDFRLDDPIPYVAVPRGKRGRLAAVALGAEGLAAARAFLAAEAFGPWSRDTVNRALRTAAGRAGRPGGTASPAPGSAAGRPPGPYSSFQPSRHPPRLAGHHHH